MDLALKNKEWKEFSINNVFIVNTGANIPKHFLKKGNIPRITATDQNNGVSIFTNNSEHKNFRKITNFISVSFLGSVFYHSYTASLDMKIHAIQIKEKPLNKYIGEFLVFILKRAVINATYGNQVSSKDLPKKKILLPVNPKGEPDYAFMEAYMRDQEKQKAKAYKTYIDKRLKELKYTQAVEPLSEKKWGEFFLYDVFTEIQRGKRLKKGDHIKGKTPYISSTGINNGVDNFIGNKEYIREFSNCLTVANSGSVGATFYQPYKFIASDHITKLENRNFNKYTYLFISNLIKRLGVKYSFNREINDKRIKREKILLPINQEGNPDYAYMENYMKQLELKKVNSYLKYNKEKVTK